MRKIAIEFFSNHGSIPTTNKNKNGSIAIEHLGLFADFGRGGSSSAVSSVNNKTGNVVLNADDVGADVAGSALAVSDALQPQITTNTDAVAMLTALLSALQASKADLTYVNEQIANLVNSDAQTLATIQAITDALAESEGLLEALDQTVANRVRFDVATQGLTALQKYNARTNIGAEETGTAAQLISQITAASIGAVTAAQLAPVATSGSYNDLTNKPSITGTLLTGLTTVAASAITATDSIIGALAKLQANIDTKADAANTLLLLNAKQNSLPTNGAAGQFLAHDLTFKTPSGGGSSDEIIWTLLTKHPLEYGIYFSEYDPPMIGRSSTGLIYIKGTVIKFDSNNSSAFSLAIIPQSFRTKQLAQLTTNNSSIKYLANVSVSFNGFLPWSVSMGRYDANSTTISITGSTIGVAGVSFSIPPTCLGMGV